MAHEARPQHARLTAAVAGQRAAASTRSLAGAAFTVPPLALVGVGLLLAFRGGGVVAEQWAPVVVGSAVALAVLALVGSLPQIPRQAWLPLAALTGYVAWGALSLLWSADPEATVESVARFSLLVLAVAVGASYAARPGAAQAAAAGLAVAGACLAVVTEVKLLAGSGSMLSGARLAWPIDYANGTAALFFMALPPLLAGAAAPRLRVGRVLAAALAALALSEGLMTLSRGGVLALVITLAVCVLLATARARFALVLAAVVLPVAVVSTRLTGGDGGSRGAWAAVAAGVAAMLLTLLCALEANERGRRLTGPLAVGLWCCVAVVAVAGFAVHFGRPDTWLSARWKEFSHPAMNRPGDAKRFGNATSNRYDYWRVAAHAFADRPLEGEGAGAFPVPWYRHRTISESVTDAHSWEAASLSETGLVGFLLLAAGLILPLIRVARARHELGLTAVALGGVGCYFVVHSSVDWLLLITAVVLPAGIALGACASAGVVSRPRLAAGRQRAGVAAVAVLIAIAAVPTYLSSTLTARAERQAATSTARALDTLRLAADANPWAVEPLIVKSQVLLDAGRPSEAVLAAREATTRAPQLWIGWAALADAERAAGARAAAVAAHGRAMRLNPRRA